MATILDYFRQFRFLSPEDRLGTFIEDRMLSASQVDDILVIGVEL